MSDIKYSMVEKIRSGEIDINNQELFFSALIKGLILNLNKCISIRNVPVPHIIIHTGSDALYLENKGQDYSIEPESVSNENYIYNIIPRCVVNPGGITLLPDQLTSPYSMGQLQYESEESVVNLVGEFRRMPLKLSVELKYFTDSYRDLLEAVQQVLTKLAFIRVYNITYMGQMIQCSYRIPDSFTDEHVTELDGKSQDEKAHILPISLEVETNMPIYSPQTIMYPTNYITRHKHSIYDLSDDLNILGEHETN